MAPKLWNKRKWNRQPYRKIAADRMLKEESKTKPNDCVAKVNGWGELNKVGLKIKYEGLGEEQKTILENLEEICAIIHREPRGKKFVFP